MKTAKKTVYLAFLFTAILFFQNCKKEDDLPVNLLFSVNIHNLPTDPYFRFYLAAFDANGELLGYGSLSDSSIWDLTAEYAGDHIDVLYFKIRYEGAYNEMYVDHISNVPTGQLFSSPTQASPLNFTYKDVVLNVEDFGNRIDNSTASFWFEEWTHLHRRGQSAVNDEIPWTTIKNGFTERNTYLENGEEFQGFMISMFERGTNDPYVLYRDQSTANLENGDTITLYKSDFTLGELKSVQVISQDNNFDNLFLTTFQSMANRRDLPLSFDQVADTAGPKIVHYITSDVLQESWWRFTCSVPNNKTTYLLSTNKPIPSSIEFNPLTGQSMARSGDQFQFTHSSKVSTNDLVRSSISFYKNISHTTFYYERHFDGSESTGTSVFKPNDIPEEILDEFPGFHEVESTESWQEWKYSQVYEDVPGNSPVEYLIKHISGVDPYISAEDEFSIEFFMIGL